MRGRALLLLMWLAACSAPPPDITCTSNGPTALPQLLATPVGHLFERVEFEVVWTPAQRCSSGPANVRRADVEVTDPDNQPLAGSALIPTVRSDANESWVTTVAFTPEKLGRHDVTVTFAPEGGFVQRAIFVASDHRADVPETGQTPGMQCERIEQLASGSLACQQWQRGVGVFRQGNLVANFWRTTMRVSGGTLVLSTSESTLGSVLDEADAGLSFSSDSRPYMETFNVTPGDTLVWFDWLSRGAHSQPDLIGGSNRSFMDLPGEKVRALAAEHDSGTILVASDTRWMRYRPWEGVDAGAWQPGELAANQTADGVWVEAVVGQALRFVPADPEQAPIALELPTGWQALSARTAGRLLPGDRPLIFPLRFLKKDDAYPALDRTEVLVPVREGRHFGYQHFVAPPGALFMDVSGGRLRATFLEEHRFYPVDR